MQLNKSIKIFINYLLGPVLFVWLFFSIYQQIKAQPQLTTSWVHIKQSFRSYKAFYLFFMIVLMFANWAIEAQKWRLAVQHIYPVSFKKAFKAILSGVSLSIATPNRVGEYAGRILYLPEGKRLRAISATFVTSLSQLSITALLGLVGFLVLKNKLLVSGLINQAGYQAILTGLLLLIIVLLAFYLRISGIVKIFQRWFQNSRHLYLVKALQEFTVRLLLKLLLLSFVRYGVFVVQYFLLFRLFDVNVPAITIWCVTSIVFLAMTIIPTITLAEVGLRGEISLKLMHLFTNNSLGVSLTTVSVWLINLIIPAVVGSILILGIKVFKRKNETV